MFYENEVGKKIEARVSVYSLQEWKQLVTKV